MILSGQFPLQPALARLALLAPTLQLALALLAPTLQLAQALLAPAQQLAQALLAPMPQLVLTLLAQAVLPERQAASSQWLERPQPNA